MADTEELQGMVIYTDGGCRGLVTGTGGYAGWGMHGYLYTNIEPKQGTGLQDHVLTVDGYVRKTVYNDMLMRKQAPMQIYPVSYVDGNGSFSKLVTNNVAELVAATKALEYAAQYAIITIKILSDSEYVINCANSWIEKYKASNWLKPDYSPVANTEYLKSLDQAISSLRNRGVLVEFDWVQSHEGHLGNTNADRYATAGVLMSKNNVFANSIETSPAQGYWKYEVRKHPFISARRMYFNTQAELSNAGVYYLGDHGKDDEVLGTRISDGAYSYVILKEPDIALETVRNIQCNITNGIDSIVMARLDYVFSPDIHKDITKFGNYSLYQRTPLRYDLFGLDNEPVTREFKPPLLSMRAVEEFSKIINLLERYRTKCNSVSVTDVTSFFYDVVEVTKKKETLTEYRIKNTLSIGVDKHEVVVNYNLPCGSGSCVITLNFNVDIVNRNTIKKLEEYKPKISIITWMESDTSFRFGTIIETQDDIGIWAGVYSNIRVVK